MKTEFLRNLKVGDQPLPKEVIDAILAENGRDIEAAKKPYEDYDTIKQQLEDGQSIWCQHPRPLNSMNPGRTSRTLSFGSEAILISEN